MKWAKMYVHVDLLQDPMGRSRKGSDGFKNKKNRAYETGENACKSDLAKGQKSKRREESRRDMKSARK